MPTKRSVVKAFLRLKSTTASFDLGQLYNDGMEVQVNVAQDNGEKVTDVYMGKPWTGYTDKLSTWKPFRIPFNAKTKPEYTDSEFTFDDKHIESIGMTGWNWVEKKSIYVAFDFDSVVGHKQGLADTDLSQLIEKAKAIPWVTVRKSTSGKGYHLYVFLDNVMTVNHTEHAALARAILGKMSAEVSFDFESKVDTCGGNIWIWHRKQFNDQKNGLALVKQGETLKDIPINWRDHLEVVTSKRAKIRMSKDKTEEDLTGQLLHIELEESHKAIIKWLESKQAYHWWDNDHHMLVCHTLDLKKAFLDSSLGIKGVFETTSSGSSTHNCFCHPMKNGAWAVRRYGKGVQEHASWTQDVQGWTTCYFNKSPDIETLGRAYGGIMDEKEGFVFPDQKKGIEALKKYGVDLGIDETVHNRTIRASRKNNMLVVTIKAESHDKESMFPGFLRKKDHWQYVKRVKDDENAEVNTSQDDMVRHLVSAGKDSGWAIYGNNGWTLEPLTHVRAVLRDMSNADTVIGCAVQNGWKLVSKPFEPEYPGNREWNRDAVSLKFLPSQKDPENLKYPTWNSIFNHLGKNLNEWVQKNEWCSQNSVTTGADYLKLWVTSLFKRPNEPLPYLFFWGGQNCGKSMFHEALQLLMVGGCIRANTALTNESDFNGELANKVLCYVEELNLSANATLAYNRLKDWVTTRNLCVHQKGATPYELRNTTHWLQCANDPGYCPVFPGDTRITVIQVSPLSKEEYIPTGEFVKRLESEASDFMAAILATELPPSKDRLNVPALESDDKHEIATSNNSDVDLWFKTRVYPCRGNRVGFAEMFDNYLAWAKERGLRNAVSKVAFGRSIPPEYFKGNDTATNICYVANCALDEDVKTSTNRQWYLKDKKMVLVND